MADQRPELTLPEAEAAAWRAECAKAVSVLEYGAGGSTLVAADLVQNVCSVESDQAWAQMMCDWFTANPTAAKTHIHHANIGPTRDWGHPKDMSSVAKWPDYALGVWDLPDFQHPDVVLIDGRFRVACFMTTAYRITRPTTVLFDDYLPRKAYHKVEEIAAPNEMIGRMARFELKPVKLTPERFRDYASALLQPL